jgi:fructosamine-3-kinase
VDDSERTVRAVLAEAGVSGAAAGVTALAGGAVNSVWRVTRSGGSPVVIKATAGAPAGMFAAEAAGLGALRDLGGLRTPAVLSVAPGWLILEALGPCPEADGAAGFWDTAGRAVAGLHGVQGQRFGWQSDGWLGMLPQDNAWCEDGHEFFAVRRLLRYLREPAAEAVLDTADRTAVERLCARLPELIPAMAPVLIHGDLWSGNVVSDPDGLPAFIDPAVCWMWAEADLSMMYCAGRPGSPEPFFAAYQDQRPLEPGWQERMPLLHLRELLSDLAHFGPLASCLAEFHRVIRPFRHP